MSSIVLESIPDDTAKASLDGILAFITPVMTSTEGLCVAIIRCIPAALAICARRQILSSTSFGEAIIRSASSSIIITICGIKSDSPFSAFIALKPFISLTECSAKELYLASISLTAQLRAPAAFLGSVTTGIIRCGIPLYTLSSTTLGSTRISFTSSGFAL